MTNTIPWFRKSNPMLFRYTTNKLMIIHIFKSRLQHIMINISHSFFDCHLSCIHGF